MRDLDKINAQGQIVFTGRVDFQVDLRGQRVELGEYRVTLTIVSLFKLIIKMKNISLDQNILPEECSKKLPL